MRALLVLVSAAVAAALLPVAPATAATAHLIGYVEAAHQSSATHVIAIAGWAADTDRRSVSVHVSVWVDGRRDPRHTRRRQPTRHQRRAPSDRQTRLPRDFHRQCRCEVRHDPAVQRHRPEPWRRGM